MSRPRQMPTMATMALQWHYSVPNTEHTKFGVGSSRVRWSWPIRSLDGRDFVVRRLMCVRQLGQLKHFISRHVVTVWLRFWFCLRTILCRGGCCFVFWMTKALLSCIQRQRAVYCKTLCFGCILNSAILQHFTFIFFQPYQAKLKVTWAIWIQLCITIHVFFKEITTAFLKELLRNR